MNPFFLFLILVPLLVSLAFWAFAFWMTVVEYGITGSMIAMHFIFGGLSAALIYLLIRSSRGPLLDDEPIRHLDIQKRRSLTNSTLIEAYCVIFVGLAVVTNLPSARYWIGGVGILMALSMLISAVFEVVLAKRLTATNAINLDSIESVPGVNLRLNYRKTRNLILYSSMMTTVLSIFCFVTFDGSRYISKFDLVGLLALLASINVWFFAKGTMISAVQSRIAKVNDD